MERKSKHRLGASGRGASKAQGTSVLRILFSVLCALFIAIAPERVFARDTTNGEHNSDATENAAVSTKDSGPSYTAKDEMRERLERAFELLNDESYIKRYYGSRILFDSYTGGRDDEIAAYIDSKLYDRRESPVLFNLIFALQRAKTSDPNAVAVLKIIVSQRNFPLPLRIVATRALSASQNDDTLEILERQIVMEQHSRNNELFLVLTEEASKIKGEPYTAPYIRQLTEKYMKEWAKTGLAESAY